MNHLILGIAFLAACEKNLVLPDATAPDASPYCAQPTPPLAPGKYVIYLNTEGVTLTNGQPNSALNTSDLVQAPGATVPPFLPGDPNRLVFIDQIVRGVRGVVAPYSLDIVTTRPTSGDYYMFVFGGDPMAITGGCAGCASISNFTCMIEPRNGVELMFDLGTAESATFYMNVILDDIGSYAGLTATADAGDCECRFDTPCQDDQRPLCMFGTMAPVTMQTQFACDRTVQDEPAMLKAAFDCRGAP